MGNASHHRPKPIKLENDIDLSGLTAPSQTREWWEAVKREVAHMERRDDRESHLPPVPKDNE